MPLEFVGQSLALTSDGLATAADNLSVGAAEIWAVLKVETSGAGYISDRRPPILYERHIFHKLTKPKFPISDICNPEPGGYGNSGANQYLRLSTALALHRTAALQSASWGIAQIMGMNFKQAGFENVEQMVAAMSGSEDAQLASFVAFLEANRLDKHLQSHNWTAFASKYNGPNFAANDYDNKLSRAFDKFAKGPLPDLKVRAAQLYLTFAHIDPGPIDGQMGSITKKALLKFQQRQGLPQTGEPDEATLKALTPA